MFTLGNLFRTTLLAVAAVLLALMGQLRSALVLLGGLGFMRLIYQVREDHSLDPATRRASAGDRPAPSDLAVETRPLPGASPRAHDGNRGARRSSDQSAVETPNEVRPGIGGFLRDLFQKVQKDNIGMLAGFVSWTLLTSMVPILVGLVAISALVLSHLGQNSGAQQAVVSHLSAATQGALSPSTIQTMVRVSTQHTGVLGLIGILGVLWGGSNIGGAISTAFQAIFEVQGRNFIKEKLLDIGMIFVFTALMLVILAGSAAGSLLDTLFAGIGMPRVVQYAVGIAISLAAAFLLFATVFVVFPNARERYKLGNVWRGALLSTVLFQILSLVWPIYARFAHFGRFGTILVPILVLTAWIYFFSMILMAGAEVVAVGAIREAKMQGSSIGPSPQNYVPQHEVLRDKPAPTR